MESILAYLFNVLPIIILGIAVFVILIEWRLLTINKKIKSHKEAEVSFLSAVLSFLPLFMANKILLIAFMFWVFQFKLFDLGFAWYIWIFAWIFYDFMFYLIHWASHTVRLFWCLHSVHHSPKEMKLSVAFRGSFGDFLLLPHVIIWLPLLGFHPFLLLIVEIFGRFYGIMVHVNENWFPNKKRHWIENILISPSAHRVHHSINPIYLDRNYGEFLSVWDLLFNTYQKEIREEVPKYGTMKEIDSENLLDTQTNEFLSLWKDIKSAVKLSDKIKYIIKPPGWNHIDGGILANEIRNNSLLK